MKVKIFPYTGSRKNVASTWEPERWEDSTEYEINKFLKDNQISEENLIRILSLAEGTENTFPAIAIFYEDLPGMPGEDWG